METASSQAKLIPDIEREPRKLKFVAYGQPEPQGSVTAFPVPFKGVPRGAKCRACGLLLANWRLTSDNPDLKKWRKTVEAAAVGELFLSEANEQTRWPIKKEAAVSVNFRFYLDRGVTVKRTYPSVKPDVDKLVRACLDALTGTLWEEDSQVVTVWADKLYAAGVYRDGPRVEVSVLELIG